MAPRMGGGHAAEFGVGPNNSTYDKMDVDDGQFNYSDRVMVEVSQKSSKDLCVRPGQALSTGGPYHFDVIAEPDHYLQLNTAGLEVRAKVTKMDGSALNPCEDVVAPVDLLGVAMWSIADVTVNGKSFNSQSTTDANTKAYMETLLSYDTDARHSHLQTQFFHLDTPHQFEDMFVHEKMIRAKTASAIKSGALDRPAEVLRAGSEEEYGRNVWADVKKGEMKDDADIIVVGGITPPGKERPRGQDETVDEYREYTDGRAKAVKDNKRYQLYLDWFDANFKDAAREAAVTHPPGINKGFENRYIVASGSVSFDMYSPVPVDFFKTNNHLAPGNKLHLTLTRADDAFLLNSKTGQYKLVLEELKLHIHCIQRLERIQRPRMEVYHMNETHLRNYVINVNRPSETIHIHNRGIMPQSIVVAMRLEAAHVGKYNLNPWNFHHWWVKNMYLEVNSVKVPTHGLQFDFNNPNALASRAYHFMFENTGAAENDRGNIVHWDAFQGGSFLVPFDLTPDRCNGIHNHKGREGDIRLHVEFAYPTENAINVAVLSCFPKVVLNDRVEGHLTPLDIV